MSGGFAPWWDAVAPSHDLAFHPDDLDLLGPLLQWLQERATGYRGGPAYFSCHMRFFEDDLVLKPVSVHGSDIVVHEIKVVKKS
ncbi:hypothetical protein ABGB18_42010 [Nonomuraea sp. B12E4]|uniref:hypothetical protein n=1 Tax=Nonomuraea sp. B12E4 TaxID=3153564 RepID=UPI00325DAD03